MNDDEDDEGRVSVPFAAATGAPALKSPAPPATVPPIKPKPKPKDEPRTYAVSSMRTSRDGLAFIVANEGAGRETDTLHWPGGRSGVTLGFGYDFLKRDSNTIIRDLTSIGVSQKVAELVSLGAGKRDREAEKFVEANAKYISLSNYQKQELLSKTIGEYETKFKNSVSFPVTQYQFDALVSLAYDPGPHFNHVTRAIAAGNLAEAEKNWLSRIYSKHRRMQGLIDRRKREVNLFNNGIYR